MKYEIINSDLFKSNRKNYAEFLKPESIAIFVSNDIFPTNADGTMPFKQNSDLFYLSGIDQEETTLVVCPDYYNHNYQEMLFVKETNEHIAVWEGNKLTKKEVSERSGISSVYWTSEFESIVSVIIPECKNIYLNANEHSRASKTLDTKQDKFIEWCKKNFPLHNYERSAPIMHKLRAVKSPLEIALIQKACNITEKAFKRVLEFVKPNVAEYEIEAEILHEFIRNRSRGPAYAPIIASGKNACILHYTENSGTCKDGELILMDIGAEYANYASDLTRTIPVNGKFSPRQKEVYEAVLRVLKKATSMLEVGNNLIDYHKEVGKLMESELIGLGLLNKEDIAKQDPNKPLYKKYFMHGTSHYLGLDVHDVGARNRPFESGMVFTCEPGIYIREEGIGIRLENDILITKDGPVNLMKNIPIEIEEIESLMNQ
ncbi:aminopeptidase P N-terminal domain-containing protein [Cytophagaceae bacterium ABcell3]|nr:aminopeptidase P N-terminal domain-containing protein [Cytophagaceae bacterium ABcell3]